MKPFIYNTIEDSSLEKEMNPSLFNETDSSYTYNGITVPRVTNILSTMLHEEYLMNWANFMGRVKHINHNDYTQEAAYIGTRVHHSIECFLLNKDDNGFDDIRDIEIKTACHNGFLSFMRWWSIISQHNYKVIFTEEPLMCPYYGGTLDLFLFIDGKKYYLNPLNGVALRYWQELDGKKYYFGADEVLRTGFKEIDGKKYYFGSDGAMKTGWQEVIKVLKIC